MPKHIDGATVWDFVHQCKVTGITAQVDVDWKNDKLLGAIDFGPEPEQRLMFADGTTTDICEALVYLFKNDFAWCDDCETNREHHDWIGKGFYDATNRCVYEHSPFTPEQLELMGPFQPQSMTCYWEGFNAALQNAVQNAGKAA